MKPTDDGWNRESELAQSQISLLLILTQLLKIFKLAILTGILEMS